MIMKKHLYFLIGIQSAVFLSFILFSLSFVKNTSTAEVHTVQSLAGAVIPNFPETESVFMQTLQNPSPGLQADGARLLARYGYGAADFLRKSPFYRRELFLCLCMAAILFLLSLLCCCHFFYTVKRQQKAERARLQTFLERCLSDDYSFLDEAREAAALCRNASPSSASSSDTFHRLEQDDLSDTFLRLAKKLRLKSEMLSQERDNTKTLVTDISHQLKTPLCALKTCFSIYSEAENEKEREEFGARCRFQLEKLENLTAALINISRLENAMILLLPAPASLTEILIEAVNAVYEKAAARQIDIDTADFPDISLQLDRKWTAEALFNILDNAVKYSPRRSRIQIRVQPFYSFVRLEIEDQGIGVPKEEYNKIFSRFYRGRSEAVQRTEGSGVGLYLSRKILEEQGGTLSVKGAAEQGSIFVVQLPLS